VFNQSAPGFDVEYRRILIIDDQVGQDLALVRLLELEGFHVTGAETGSAGLGLVRSAPWDAIVLDLCLPDVDGLILLDQFHATNVAAPVVVVTGHYLDVDHAVAAMKRGAFDFKHKPLLADELASTLRDAIRSVPRPKSSQFDASPSTTFPTSVRALLEALRDADKSRPQKFSDSVQQSTGVISGGVREMIAVCLFRAITDRESTVPVFLACATSLSRVLDADVQLTAEFRRALVVSIERAASKPALCDPRVSKALTRLEELVSIGSRGSEEALAREMFVDRAHLGRPIVRETGVGFRQWPRAVAIRAAVRSLCHAGTPVSSIAADLGYEHSQLDREFRELIGVTPQVFRRLIAHFGRKT
jgi:FixJ family two-component response regulator/AraC-like DNA-binding protein